MAWDQADLRAIACAALTLDERLALPATAFVPNAPKARERIEQWRQNLGADFPMRLGRRLELLGLNEQAALDRLGDVDPNRMVTLPDWLDGFARLTADLAGEVPLPKDLAEIPFAHILWPIASAEAARLFDHHPAGAALLTAQAREDVAGALLRLISTVASHCLFAEFDIWRRSHRGNDVYGSFVRHFRASGHRAFFGEYAWLGRRLVTFVQSHFATTGTFLDRLAADLGELEAHPDLPVTRINIGLSDRHEGGATVIMVDFASGRRLVYKPKSIDSELWFSRFARCVGELAGIEGGLVAPGAVALARAGYGWAAFVPHQPCADAAALRRYYQRAGGLAALVHAINGYDFHEENVIASGEWPVLIDFETLFNPEPLRTDGQDGPQHGAFSVMNTMLLTAWMPSAQGGSVDIGGFTGCLDDVPQVVACYLDPNSPAMRWGRQVRPDRRGTNLPRLGLQPQMLHDNLPAFRDGFDRVYRALSSTLGPSGAGPGQDLASLLAEAETLTFRHILRHTRIYVTLLEASYQPALNRSGLEMSLHYEQVMRVSFLGTWKRDQAGFVQQELAALMAEDVPVFYRRNDGRDLMAPTGAAVTGFFGASGMAAHRRHMGLADSDELWRQQELIGAAVFAATAQPDLLQPGVEGVPFAAASAPEPDDALIDQAAAIAEDAIRRAFHLPEGALDWQGALPSEAHMRYQVGGLDHGLYAGNGGIALFLAAMDRARPGRGYAEAARAAMAMRPEDLGRPEDVEGFRVPIGGYAGAGALIYAQTRLANLLREPDRIETASRLAALISPVHVAMDRQFDVLNGAAGLIMSLLDLSHAGGAEHCLRLAEVAGQHLLDHAVPQPDGALAWPTIGGTCHGGFAHGTAGIAVALIRLGHRLSRADFHDAGLAALRHQDGLWDEQQGNWRDLRRDNGACSCQWCYGATGTGFAFLALRGALADAEVEAGLARAITALRNDHARHGGALVDHLCCGNAGSALLMMQAGHGDEARRMIAGLATSRAEPSGFVLYPRGAGRDGIRAPVFPGLMQGTAGIGLACLAAARPDLPLADVMTLSTPDQRFAT